MSASGTTATGTTNRLHGPTRCTPVAQQESHGNGSEEYGDTGVGPSNSGIYSATGGHHDSEEEFFVDGGRRIQDAMIVINVSRKHAIPSRISLSSSDEYRIPSSYIPYG